MDKMERYRIKHLILEQCSNHLIRGYNNMKSMFRKSSPHFIEIKSYMHIVRSTNGLEYSNMMEEVREQRCKESEISILSYVSRISLGTMRDTLIYHSCCKYQFSKAYSNSAKFFVYHK